MKGMKKVGILKILLILVLLTSIVNADPFLSCDPESGRTEYKIDWASGVVEYIKAQPDGSLYYDLNAIPEGETTGTLYGGAEWLLDGQPQGVFRWSAGRPFVLTSPLGLSIPTGLRLIKREAE